VRPRRGPGRRNTAADGDSDPDSVLDPRSFCHPIAASVLDPRSLRHPAADSPADRNAEAADGDGDSGSKFHGSAAPADHDAGSDRSGNSDPAAVANPAPNDARSHIYAASETVADAMAAEIIIC